MAVIKNKKTGMWEVRTYYKNLTGERKQNMWMRLERYIIILWFANQVSKAKEVVQMEKDKGRHLFTDYAE